MALSTQLHANNASTTLNGPIGALDLTMTVVDGSSFPNPTTGQYFLVTIEIGGAREIIKVTGRSGNTFTISARGQEGTTPAPWANGALVESRTTKDTLGRFARYQDRLFELTSINDLVAPSVSDSNSYITNSVDDNGNVIIAIKRNASIWKFLSHRKQIVAAGTATAGAQSTTQLVSTDIGTLLNGGTPAGQYVLQFTNGNLSGQSRLITSASSNTIGWSGVVSEAPTVAVTTFEIYQSDSSLLFPNSNTFVRLVGDTMTGALVLNADPSTALGAATKQYVDTATIVAIGTNTTLTNSAVNKIHNITAVAVVTLPLANTVTTGQSIRFKSTTEQNVTIVPQGSDTLDNDGAGVAFRLPSYSTCSIMQNTSGSWIISVKPEAYVGETKEFYGTTVPRGWAWSNGQLLNRVNQGGLFAVVGTTHNAGDGSTTYGTPDKRGRASFGKNDMGGAADSARITVPNSGVNGSTLGAVGGDERLHGHTHTVSGTTGGQSADHTHTVGIQNVPASGPSGGPTMWAGGSTGTSGVSNDHTHAFSGTSATTGAGTSQNLPPAIICNFIIKT
jgi:microcystin-dependent protein